MTGLFPNVFGRSGRWFTTACFAVVTTVGTAAAADSAATLEAFAKHIDGLAQVDATAKQSALKTLEDANADPVDAMMTALAELYPGYQTAIAATDDGSVTVAIDQLTPLAEAKDSYLAADASFYLARVLMNDERFEAAMPLLERLTNELSNFSLHPSVTQYYLGVAQAGLLDHKAATQSLITFLEQHPDAPERLRVSAWRKAQELQAIQEGKLDDIYQRMDFSRRRLEQVKTDEATQDQQDKIVQMLGKLIKEEEKKEATSSCKNCKKSNKKKTPKKQQAKSQSKPKPGENHTPGSSGNPNGKVVDKSYDDSPASPWSRLRDRSRDPANNAVKEKLPARYRDIVEKYYEAANGNAE